MFSCFDILMVHSPRAYPTRLARDSGATSFVSGRHPKKISEMPRLSPTPMLNTVWISSRYLNVCLWLSQGNHVFGEALGRSQGEGGDRSFLSWEMCMARSVPGVLTAPRSPGSVRDQTSYLVQYFWERKHETVLADLLQFTEISTEIQRKLVQRCNSDLPTMAFSAK